LIFDGYRPHHIGFAKIDDHGDPRLCAKKIVAHPGILLHPRELPDGGDSGRPSIGAYAPHDAGQQKHQARDGMRRLLAMIFVNEQRTFPQSSGARNVPAFRYVDGVAPYVCRHAYRRLAQNPNVLMINSSLAGLTKYMHWRSQ
jgi:hypothetical protein